MALIPGNVYHLYNRGINRQQLFFQERNYDFFAAKLERHLAPHCQLLAWCLMPNHFHVLLAADHRSLLQTASGRICFEEGLRLLLSSYTRAINKQENRVGNLFQQNTRCKCVWDTTDFRGPGYVARCIRYLHDNPVQARLVPHRSHWPWSSWQAYAEPERQPWVEVGEGLKWFGHTDADLNVPDWSELEN